MILNPEISVVIPIYNTEIYISECLESVINQTFKNIEIICIDDCTNDKSVKIVEKYMNTDERIKLVRHSENLGLAESRNTGINHSSGKYIFFLDSDDYILPDILEKLYKKIQEDNSDVVCSRYKAFTLETEQLFLQRVDEYNKYFVIPLKFQTLQVTMDNFCSFYDPILHVAWGRLYKNEFIKKNNITFIHKNIVCEDEGFFIKVFVNFPKLSFIDDVGVMYRIRKNSIISQTNKIMPKKKKLKQVKIVINDALEYIKNKYDKKMAADLISKIKFSEVFGGYFIVKIPFIFTKYWSDSNKKIALFGVDLYREKIKNEHEKIYKILGIVVKKEKILNIQLTNYLISNLLPKIYTNFCL